MCNLINTYIHTVANPARGLLNREKRTKRENLAAPPRPLPLLIRRKYDIDE